MSLIERIESAAAGRLLDLPPRALRILAGRPVVRDGQTLEVEPQLMLRLLRLTRRDNVDFTADSRPTIDRESRLVGGVQPIGEIRDLSVDGAEGPRRARLYVPHSLVQSSGPDPLLVFFHGGGFVTGSIESHDASCRVVAERAGVRVLSVDYRLAPEHPFPAAPQDCIAAYRWVVAHAKELGADPERLAVGGDSAGGNLATVTAIAAAREGLPLKFQLLVYPVVHMGGASASRQKFATGFFLTKTGMDSAESNYLGDQEPTHPDASPLLADLPAGLAPAYVATAGFDPLRDEGEAYVTKLQGAGVEVTHERFSGHIHSFFNVVGVGRAPRIAVEQIAGALGKAL